MALRLGFRAALPNSSPPKQAPSPRLCATQAAVESVRTIDLLSLYTLPDIVPLNRCMQTAPLAQRELFSLTSVMTTSISTCGYYSPKYLEGEFSEVRIQDREYPLVSGRC